MVADDGQQLLSVLPSGMRQVLDADALVQHDLVELVDEYRALCRAIDGNDNFVIPTPLTTDELEKTLMDYGLLG